MNAMSRTTTAENSVDMELVEQVRAYLATFVKAGEKPPSHGAIAKALERRKTSVSRAIRFLQDEEATLAARVVALPEIPHEIRETFEAMLQSVWASSHDSNAAAAANLQKQLIEERRIARGRLANLEDLLEETEEETDAAVARAEAAEEALKRSDDERARLAGELIQAQASRAERGRLEAMFEAMAGSGRRSTGRKGKAEAAPEETPPSEPSGPETGDLPMRWGEGEHGDASA